MIVALRLLAVAVWAVSLGFAIVGGNIAVTLPTLGCLIYSVGALFEED